MAIEIVLLHLERREVPVAVQAGLAHGDDARDDRPWRRPGPNRRGGLGDEFGWMPTAA